MTPELAWMVAHGGWTIALALLAANGTAFREGLRWGIGNRTKAAANTGWVGRAHRAHRNQLENYPVFVALVVALHLTETHHMSTVVGATLFGVARIAFSVIYIAGITWMGTRTLLYFVSLGGLVLMASAWWSIAN